MIDRLKNIFQLKDSELVRWKDLEGVPYFKWIDLKTGLTDKNNGVVFMKYKTKAPNQLLFITEGKAKDGYDHHFHDCKETITCMKGSCIINDKVTLNEGDTYVFQKNTRHKVYAGSEGFTLMVEFNK